MAHPTVLADLLARYETLRALDAAERTPRSRQRLEDVSYTLCVSTGTREVSAALAEARRQLSGTQASEARSGSSVLPAGR
nr:DUF5133 domain-containing protein [Streptomyces albus]